MKESTINSTKVLEKIVHLRTALGISQYDMVSCRFLDTSFGFAVIVHIKNILK